MFPLVNTFRLKIFAELRIFANDAFVVTQRTFVTLIELDTNTFPITFIDCCSVDEPMFAVCRYEFAKRRLTDPRPEMPVLEGWMTPVVDVYPVRKVFWKWYTEFWKVATLVTFEVIIFAANMFAVV